MIEFDEAFYLTQNPDVATAVERGDWPSGFVHYCVTGKSKGRKAAPPLDADWYLRVYPVAETEIASGRAASATDHYHRIGKFRGYLPSRTAYRPENPAAPRSRFGGLWTDVGNALDIVAGRLDIGQITTEQAVLLQRWVSDGYIILPAAIPDVILDRAEGELERAYRGEIPDLRFAVHGIGENTHWVPETLNRPAKALDLHWSSQIIRDLIFSPQVLGFLHLIFERQALASQTLGFWRGSQQDGHQDSAYVNYSLPMQFAASWIALEDVREGAGELFYHRGSHYMPDFVYARRFKGAEEAKRVMPNIELEKDYPRHIELIRQQAEGLELRTEQFRARRGDVLFWSADLAHGGSKISVEQTRKSVVTHYCPAEVVPSYFELRERGLLRKDASGAFYSSPLSS